MKIINQIFIIAALVFVSLANVAAQKSNDKAFAPMQKEHAEALKTWLKTKPNLRPATEADCTNKSGLKLQREGEADYQPYYLARDFNGDEKTDFAVALVDTKKRGRTNFALVIFNQSKSGYAQAHYQTNLDLRESGFYVWSDSPHYLAVGEFQTDNCGYFKWTGKKYEVIDCTAGESEN